VHQLQLGQQHHQPQIYRKRPDTQIQSLPDDPLQRKGGDAVKNPEITSIDAHTAFLPGSRALVINQSEPLHYSAEKAKPLPGKFATTYPKVVPWGQDNDLPQLILDRVGKDYFMSPNLLFNVLVGYGDGIMPAKRIIEGETVRFVPYEGNAEVRTFFEENNTVSYLLEQLTDLNWFYNVFPELIFNKENGAKRKIVQIDSKEAMFSRWSEAGKDDKGRGVIKYHYYSSLWGDGGMTDADIIITPVLDRRSPVRHLREMMKEDENKTVASRRNRVIVPVSLPTPGKPYYSKPYWFALFDSGVYDFGQKIMPFKNAALDNQANIKYIIELGPGYFEDIFRRERITDDKKQEERRKKEYADFDKFLKGHKNTHKSIITFQKYGPDNKPYPMVTIKQVESKVGGELIADNEEVANITAYAQSVHPSLVGAAPGKTKTINGTEARELFALKQSMQKPMRDLLLTPFYIIKAINQWPEDLHFTIPNLQLTTLDKNKTGQETVIPAQ